jgi:glycosyltransferase involved in cell wall biosynthesis
MQTHPVEAVPLTTASKEARAQAVVVSVVCPFYNEGPLIVAAMRRMVANLHAQLNSWELILVNDGSTDRGPDLLIGALDEMKDPRIRFISYPVNYGRGRALKTGIDAAAGDVIVTTEADCSWGDDVAKRLSDALLSNIECDLVVASPHRQGGKFIGVPATRVLLTRWGNRLISLFFRSGLTMHTGMTRAYRRDVIVPLRTYENGKEFHLEVLFKLLTLKFRAHEIPATLSWKMRNESKGTKRHRILDARIIKVIQTHFVFLFLADPMRLFSGAAILTFLVSLIFLILATHNLIVGGVSVFYAMLSMFFLLFGFLFIGFAVVLTRMRDQSIEVWLRDYPTWPPMRSRPEEIYPRKAEARS